MDQVDERTGLHVLSFLSLPDQQALQCVCKRWFFTCPWMQCLAQTPLRYQLEHKRFWHPWTMFMKDELRLLLPMWLESQAVVHDMDTEVLLEKLGESTNSGTRPSFGNANARSGYIREKINRCTNLPNILLTKEMSTLRSRIFRHGKKTWTMAMFGGGPGFDVVGMALLRKYMRAQDVHFRGIVYDNESGWKSAIQGIQTVLDEQQYEGVECSFRTCDITDVADHRVNQDVADRIGSIQLFIFAFVCVENYFLLQESNYIFLRSLFASAQVGSVFIFTDSTHRLWPIIAQVAQETGVFKINTPHTKVCKNPLVLEKLPPSSLTSNHSYYEQAMEKLERFRLNHAKKRYK